jgi:hypothetical protein
MQNGIRLTTCRIHAGECVQATEDNPAPASAGSTACASPIQAFGSAQCEPLAKGRGDVFKASIGKKIALERALHSARLPRPERAALWHAFFERTTLARKRR